MSNYDAILRVAKILARATSPEQAEAQTALESALKRMQRDGVSLQDLLTLPTEELFQNTLFKLADLIVSQQESLSPTGKRAAYEQYALLIVTKFSGDWNGHTSSGYGAKTNQERGLRGGQRLRDRRGRGVRGSRFRRPRGGAGP